MSGDRDGDGGRGDDERTRSELPEAELRADDVSTISHDLKSPLSIISLDVCLLQERLPAYAPPDLRRALTRIEQNVAFINRLVHDLLDLSSIDAARFEVLLEPTELSGLVNEVVERATPARDRMRVFVDPCRPCRPMLVLADGPRLERVVANLLQNALKFAPSDSEVAIRMDMTEDRACVSVIDQGPGLAPHEASLVFDKFRRARSARHHEGTGLGLFVSRKIVEAHGGRIGVDSVFGQGSRFFFELPRIDDRPGCAAAPW